MKIITLTQNQIALVDDEDFEWINRCKWRYNQGYAVRTLCAGKLRKTLYMHREIMHAATDVEIDHIDEQGCNNQKYNLRLATHPQNQWNRGKNSNNKTGFKGVSKHNKNNCFVAHIWLDNKSFYLGSFAKPEEAAQAYRYKEKEYRGEFAHD